MYTFEKDSVIVESWVTLIMSEVYKEEQVPQLYNLREVVHENLLALGFKEVAKEEKISE